MARARPRKRCASGGDALGVRVAEDDREGDGRQDEAEAVQLRGGEDEEGGRGRRRRARRRRARRRRPGSRGARCAGSSRRSRRSTIRLNDIAADRAPTIATRIQRSVRPSGTPPAARTAERSANGSAKTVWAKTTRERKSRADGIGAGRVRGRSHDPRVPRRVGDSPQKEEGGGCTGPRNRPVRRSESPFGGVRGSGPPGLTENMSPNRRASHALPV